MNRGDRPEASSNGGINITGCAGPSAGAAAQSTAGINNAIIIITTNTRELDLDMALPFKLDPPPRKERDHQPSFFIASTL